MKPDLILANSPYGKPGVDITKYIMENLTDANYAMLGTRSMFKKYYDKLACQFVQIGKYELGSNVKLDWGAEQAILLATNGWTEVVDNRKKKGDNTVQMSQSQIPYGAFTVLRNATLVQINLSDTSCAAATHSRSATLVPDDVKRRSGYLYVSFETFEEACECAIDIISWKNPTDSHYRCIRWGFVQGLIAHERYS